MIYHFNLNSTPPAVGEVIVINNIWNGTCTYNEVITVDKTEKDYVVITRKVKENEQKDYA